jgi:CDP-glycerol glycerophosphotransferase
MLKEKKFKDFKFIWAFKNTDNYDFLKTDRTVLVKYGSKDYYKCISSSKYWVTNSRLPEYIQKKKDQVYIQCWHGTPLKKLGYDILLEDGNALNTIKEIREKYNFDAKRYDFLISPSAFCTEKFVSAFNLKKLGKENVIVELGYPRNDYLFTNGF